MNKKYLLLFFLLPTFLRAQDQDLLALLGEEKSVEYATASFKTNRVINGHSIENTAAGLSDRDCTIFSDLTELPSGSGSITG
jgi:hypothetical protein